MLQSLLHFHSNLHNTVTSDIYDVKFHSNLHNTVSSTAIFVAITNNILYGSKLYIFILCQKSLDIKIMLHEDIPTVNISKLNYWLLICIAKNLIWTTLKMIFSIFRFLCSRFLNNVQTIHQWKYNLFRWCINLMTLMTSGAPGSHYFN